jgi:putative redox protein
VSAEATVTLRSGVCFEARADSGHTVIIDGPGEAGGENAGFRPMELMLLGMGGCMALDVVLILQRMRKQVTGYTVHVKAERAEDPPRVYTEVKLEHLIQGDGLEASAVQRAIELAETTYCSGSAMFAKTAKITNTFRILPG